MKRNFEYLDVDYIKKLESQDLKDRSIFSKMYYYPAHIPASLMNLKNVFKNLSQQDKENWSRMAMKTALYSGAILGSVDLWLFEIDFYKWTGLSWLGEQFKDIFKTFQYYKDHSEIFKYIQETIKGTYEENIIFMRALQISFISIIGLKLNNDREKINVIDEMFKELNNKVLDKKYDDQSNLIYKTKMFYKFNLVYNELDRKLSTISTRAIDFMKGLCDVLFTNKNILKNVLTNIFGKNSKESELAEKIKTNKESKFFTFYKKFEKIVNTISIKDIEEDSKIEYINNILKNSQKKIYLNKLKIIFNESVDVLYSNNISEKEKEISDIDIKIATFKNIDFNRSYESIQDFKNILKERKKLFKELYKEKEKNKISLKNIIKIQKIENFLNEEDYKLLFPVIYRSKKINFDDSFLQKNNLFYLINKIDKLKNNNKLSENDYNYLNHLITQDIEISNFKNDRAKKLLNTSDFNILIDIINKKEKEKISNIANTNRVNIKNRINNDSSGTLNFKIKAPFPDFSFLNKKAPEKISNIILNIDKNQILRNRPKRNRFNIKNSINNDSRGLSKFEIKENNFNFIFKELLFKNDLKYIENSGINIHFIVNSINKKDIITFRDANINFLKNLINYLYNRDSKFFVFNDTRDNMFIKNKEIIENIIDKLNIVDDFKSYFLTKEHLVSFLKLKFRNEAEEIRNFFRENEENKIKKSIENNLFKELKKNFLENLNLLEFNISSNASIKKIKLTDSNILESIINRIIIQRMYEMKVINEDLYNKEISIFFEKMNIDNKTKLIIDREDYENIDFKKIIDNSLLNNQSIDFLNSLKLDCIDNFSIKLNKDIQLTKYINTEYFNKIEKDYKSKYNLSFTEEDKNDIKLQEFKEKIENINSDYFLIENKIKELNKNKKNMEFLLLKLTKEEKYKDHIVYDSILNAINKFDRNDQNKLSSYLFGYKICQPINYSNKLRKNN